MNEADLISVIVPVYKVEAYLDRCIASIVNQTYKNIEIILIDDGSPDNSPSICDMWSEMDPRIKVIHKSNGGLSDARNTGINAANGEYVAFVDSDDWIAPKMLERLLYAVKQYNADISACTVKMIWDDNRPDCLLTVQTNCVLSREEAQAELLKEKLLKHPVWYKLYKKDVIDGILFEVGKHHEDVFWSYQVFGRASCTVLIDYIGYYYYQRSGSIMGKAYSLSRLDALEAVEKRYEYIAEAFPDLEQEARLSILSQCIYHGQMVLRYLSGDEKRKAFELISETKQRYKYSYQDYKSRSLQRRFWLTLGRISLPFVCMVRNMMHIGL